MSTLGEEVEKLMDIDGIKTDGHTIHNPEVLEVGGVKIVQIKNRAGRVWSVPADDDNVDINEGGLRNILKLPNPEPDFFYQYIRDEQLGDYLGRDFALVEPADVGLPARSLATPAIGTAPTSHHQVGNMHLVMIPKRIEARYRRAEKMRADEATAGIKTRRKLGKAVDETDVEFTQRKTEQVKGQPIVTKQPGYKEYPENE